MMKYCMSYGFSPYTLTLEADYSAPWHLWLVRCTEILFIALGLVIIFKMCQLCSKAFSYSNFHIHQAYKFYTLALISTVIIVCSRAVQLYFGVKLSEENSEIGPYKQGWVLLNEMIGLISIYTVNLMYTLNSLTWLMIASKCDFNEATDNEELDMEEEDDSEAKKQKHKLFLKYRNILMYGFLPLCMVLSIILLLNHSQGACQASKVITQSSNFMVFVLMFYSLFKILRQTIRDSQVPKKVKIIWMYILGAMTVRQLIMLVLSIYDLVDPVEDEQGNTHSLVKWQANVITFFFAVFITTVPIFLLSYLADKQLEVEKEEINQGGRIIYSSTII